MGMIITVDGPSGAGKGTLCYALAEKLGFTLLDSGAIYRVTALAALKRHADLTDEEGLAELARHLDISSSFQRMEKSMCFLEGWM